MFLPYFWCKDNIFTLLFRFLPYFNYFFILSLSATMPLFFRQFVHKGLFTNSYISAQRFAKLKFLSCGGVNMSEKMISRF